MNGEERAEPAAVEFSDVWFSYDGRPLLKGINLTIPRLDFACIIGPNGSGKTTMLKLILGLLRPDRGRIRVLGREPVEARPMTGYVPQQMHVDTKFPVSVLEVVLMGRLGPARLFGGYTAEDIEASMEALSEVGLADEARRPFSSLSGGQQQRVLIARAIVSDPALLLMDEPTSNLDIHSEEHLHELLAKLNDTRTIITVSHDLGFVSKFVKSVVCVKGRAVRHPTRDVEGRLFESLYGLEVRLVEHERSIRSAEEDGGEEKGERGCRHS